MPSRSRSVKSVLIGGGVAAGQQLSFNPEGFYLDHGIDLLLGVAVLKGSRLRASG